MSPNFIENKVPDIGRISSLLDQCRIVNRWANRGPLFDALAASFAEHVNLAPDRRFVPCANGGIALEAMARLHAIHAGRKLRWVASAFSFSNLGRGHFADVIFVDCDLRGLLDIDAIKAMPCDAFDGLILTNPHGLYADFSEFTQFARANGKALLIDNAAGMAREIPDWPWQSFSLHQTKPYGVGEGGLALVPAEQAEELYRLIAYDFVPQPADAWLNNGKISDIACAFILDRLQRVDKWSSLYRDQAKRVLRIAKELGFQPLRAEESDTPATSIPMLFHSPVSSEDTKLAARLPLAKFYKPLRPLPTVTGIFSHLVNVATHSDIALLTDDEIKADLARIGRVKLNNPH